MKDRLGDNAYEVECKVERRYREDVFPEGARLGLGSLHWEGAEQRLTVAARCDGEWMISLLMWKSELQGSDSWDLSCRLVNRAP